MYDARISEVLVTVEFSVFPTALGTCGIAWRVAVVVATCLPEQTAGATVARMARRSDAAPGTPSSAIQAAIDAITALLNGERVDLSAIACDLGEASAFESRVYAIARDIGVGATRTYGDIAEELGDKALARSVGMALGRNPLPIIVPCHRVIGANNRLTGFSAAGGIETKLKMLEIEGITLGDGPGLFDDLPMALKPKG